MKTPRITETEWEIMKVVWARHPITASGIVRELASVDPTWHPKTTRALLNRLVQKKALDYERQGRVHVYEPLVTEEECIAAESESFLARIFGGALQPMLAHFVERRRIGKDELDELRRLLEKRSGNASRNRRKS